jgi:diacylglycerol kinase family enzyme
VRTCVIFNPTAKGEKARRFRRHLDEIATQAALKLTTGPNDARRLAAEAVAEKFEIIVAAGGDGTVNEVLNGLAGAPEGLERARLGVLPLGTVNVFARELGLPINLVAAWKTIRRGQETRIDLPGVEYVPIEVLEAGTPPLVQPSVEPVGKSKETADTRHSQSQQAQRNLCVGRVSAVESPIQEHAASVPSELTTPTPQKRYFAQMAGAGLDARAVELVNWPLKKKIGPLAYVVAGLQALMGPPARITAAAGAHRATGGLVLIGNGRLYGGSFRIFPGADLRDGLLEVVVFPHVNWFTLARCGPQLLLTGTLPAGATDSFRAEQVTLTSPAPVPLETDGELIGRLPATFSIKRSRLRVIVP